MKKTIILTTLLFTLFAPVLSKAQSAPASQEDVTKSLEIARNIIKASTGLADDFVNYKGEFLQKDGSDNAYYTVKDIDVGTSTQYVVVRAKGGTIFAAIYTGKDKQDKGPILAFTAFTGGVITLRKNSDLSIVADDAPAKGTLKYYLKIKDTKIASFTYDVEANKGTLLVAVQ